MERFSFVKQMSFHNISMDSAGTRCKGALRLPFHLEAGYVDAVYSQMVAGRLSYIPFYGHVYDYSFEPAFIRKRNERERHRVRCVNEGYAHLREHLPQEFEDRRLSKVETLRAAIDYIKHLQNMLELDLSRLEMSTGDARSHAALPQTANCGSSDGECQSCLDDCGDAVYQNFTDI